MCIFKDKILMQISFGEPTIRIGLCEDGGFGLQPHGKYQIQTGDNSITYIPADKDAYMQISGIRIGRNFHWDSKCTMRYAGIIQLLRHGNHSSLINLLKAEQYLQSVVGSEMNPGAPTEFIKAHAIIARSWLMRLLSSKRLTASNPIFNPQNPLITWTNASAHTDFDVCPDDHCQRYQGLDAITPRSAEAVAQTRGLVLMDANEEIADTRYSKCCGGVTELFSTCWDNVDYPYLTAVEDPFCNPDRLENALKTHPNLLKDYDMKTSNYYTWQETVTADLIKNNLKKYFDLNPGEIIDLIPLKTGPSGRIFELKIIGTSASFTFGKELTIRRILSQTHLLSSAFTISSNGNPKSFILTGKGWGHGVGLCQIGAAVMAVEGSSYEQILAHYYPGTHISTIYP